MEEGVGSLGAQGESFPEALSKKKGSAGVQICVEFGVLLVLKFKIHGGVLCCKHRVLYYGIIILCLFYMPSLQ